MENLDGLLENKIPDVLYHYTGGNAFLGIISKKEMWASHIRFMNDLKEEILALEILERRVKLSQNLQNLDVLKVFEETKKFFIKETAEKGIFILSFSEKKDDLNQWRGYANEIPAYCIGIDIKKLIDSEEIQKDEDSIKQLIRSSWNPNNRKKKVFIAPCIYDPSKQEMLVDEVINDSFNHLSTISNTITEVVLGKEIAKRLIFYSPLIKHKMSESEKEWRIIIVYEKSYAPNFTQEDLHRKLENAKTPDEREHVEYDMDCYEANEARLKEDEKLLGFRMGKSLIIPYFKFALKNEFFKEFIIGACPDRDSLRESTLYFLSKNGFTRSVAEAMVSHTENPYRNW